MRRCVLLALAACHHAATSVAPPVDPIAERYPLARLSDRALCDRLLARTAADYGVWRDREPRVRRKVIVSDLHLGPGTADARFTGIEDFYAEAEWTAFVREQGALGPTDLIIDGDFLELWQIAAGLGALPARDDPRQPSSGPVLAGDQALGVTATQLAIAAHAPVFHALGTLIATGDHRVIIIAGNHDADLLWPKVQLAIARAIAPRDPARLIFVDAAAYEHAGVHVEHGHALDPANRFATGHAPFGRDRDGRCRLQSSWGEIFVDRFYTQTEREIPFIDNLYPESAAILWAMRDGSNAARDLGAAVRFLELIRVAESPHLNREAASSVLDSVLGTGDHGDALAHLADRLGQGDAGAAALASGAMRLVTDPELATLWAAVIAAARALPDAGAAFAALRTADPSALVHLHDVLLGEPFETAATRLVAAHPELRVVVYGHTHAVGGELHALRHGAYYANTGSWLSVASVADLRAHHVDFAHLSLADRTMFPTRATAVIVEYDGDVPRTPKLRNAPTR